MMQPAGATSDPLSEFISILIPTKNRAAVLEKCLLHLAKQGSDAGDFEVIVVDDCSTDGTADRVGRSAASLPMSVRLFRQPKSRGANAARNLGVREARGEVVVFLDDDVLVPEGWLRALISGFRAAGLPVATGPVRLVSDGEIPGRHRGEITACLTEVLGPATGPGGISVPVTANMVGLRRHFEQTRFDEAVQAPNEETDWLLRSKLAVAFLPDAWVWHYKKTEELQRLRLLRLAWRRGGEDGRWVRERLHLSFWRRLQSAAQSLTTAVRAFGHGLLLVCWGGIVVGAGQTSRGLALLGLTRRESLPRAAQ
jgi:glycosyltransferase involved in cell wall biosynthesis